MPIEIKKVTEYRNIGGVLYKTHAETAAEKVLCTHDGVNTTVQTVLDSLADYQGATASGSGVPGFVPSASSAERDCYLRGDGTWDSLDLITTSQIDALFA